jgi:hypothetical protein
MDSESYRSSTRLHHHRDGVHGLWHRWPYNCHSDRAMHHHPNCFGPTYYVEPLAIQQPEGHHHWPNDYDNNSLPRNYHLPLYHDDTSLYSSTLHRWSATYGNWTGWTHWWCHGSLRCGIALISRDAWRVQRGMISMVRMPHSVLLFTIESDSCRRLSVAFVFCASGLTSASSSNVSFFLPFGVLVRVFCYQAFLVVA